MSNEKGIPPKPPEPKISIKEGIPDLAKCPVYGHKVNSIEKEACFDCLRENPVGSENCIVHRRFKSSLEYHDLPDDLHKERVDKGYIKE